ncbi:MAG: hypothetical protein EOL88_00595 [Bacteroidia bacterium]|nr:hypothetical protein [Bacteroidia bacterium]
MPRKKEQKNSLPSIEISSKKKPKKSSAKKSVAKKGSKKKKTDLTDLTTPKPKDKLGRDRSKEKEKTAKNKAKFLDALKDSFGIVTNACAKVKISNVTFYNWYKEDEEFKKAVDEIDDSFDTIVDDKIKQGIIKGDGSMVRFYAGRKMKKYRQKVGLGQDEDLEPFEFIITTKKSENGKD